MFGKSLEKEFTIRMFTHQQIIARAYLTKKFIDREQAKGGVMLALPCIVQQAEEYSENEIQYAMFNGRFEDLYNEAWESMKDDMPEHLKFV